MYLLSAQSNSEITMVLLECDLSILYSKNCVVVNVKYVVYNLEPGSMARYLHQ